MRTTLDIEDDVMAAAKELARLQHNSVGQVVSRLLRQALAGQSDTAEMNAAGAVAGFRPFPVRGSLVTNDQVNALRDSEGV